MDRRRKPRIYEPFRAKVRGINAGGEPFEVSTVLDNMSAGGLYLRVDENVKRGEEIFITVRLSTIQIEMAQLAKVAVQGVVLRSEPLSNGTYGLGISISNRRFIS